MKSNFLEHIPVDHEVELSRLEVVAYELLAMGTRFFVRESPGE